MISELSQNILSYYCTMKVTFKKIADHLRKWSAIFKQKSFAYQLYAYVIGLTFLSYALFLF